MSHEHILVIDHQEYWRTFSKQALESAGFHVLTHDTSNYMNTELNDAYETMIHEEEGQQPEPRPDLIIFGCTQVGTKEQALIEQFLVAQYHLLVVSAFLPWQVMRSLFLQGVADVTDKPYTSTSLVATVRDALQSILARDQ